LVDRRNFLIAAAGLAALIHPHQLAAAADLPSLPIPSDALFACDEERYWSEIRRQFIIPEGEIYLNNGTVGSCPLPVLKAAIDGYLEGEKLAQPNSDDYPLWGYNGLDYVREPLAAFVGADKGEIALVRNATEANNYIANGLDLAPGDEVLMSDQEHPGGEEPWRLREKRHSIRVKKFTLPKPANSPADILNRISDAITPRTRVIFVSHATTITGMVLPAKQICKLARDKGILAAIDGAQALGMFKLDLRDLACDMYSASAHKWLQAPKGTGFLYVRKEVQSRLWNTLAGESWDRPGAGAERFQMFGTSNLPAMLGLRAALQFATQIGIDRIEARHRHLANTLLKRISDPSVESWTSPDPALRCALVSLNKPGLSRAGIQTWLWERHRIRIRGWDPSCVRISTSYFVSKEELLRFADLYQEYAKGEVHG
jgi:isopenicillin-N epimerase